MENTNYFQISLFRKEFPKNIGGLNDGLFINLDFGILRDLAVIDYEFRQALLSVSTDIEYFFKTSVVEVLGSASRR